MFKQKNDLCYLSLSITQNVYFPKVYQLWCFQDLKLAGFLLAKNTQGSFFFRVHYVPSSLHL